MSDNKDGKIILGLDIPKTEANINADIKKLSVPQNLFRFEDIKSVLDIINTIGNEIDWLTNKLQLFNNTFIGVSEYLNNKSLG